MTTIEITPDTTLRDIALAAYQTSPYGIDFNTKVCPLTTVAAVDASEAWD